MSEDIVEKLRAEAPILPDDVYGFLNPLLLEAADEIERLRRELGKYLNDPPPPPDQN